MNPRMARVAAHLLSHGERRDRSYRIFATDRRVRFTEMEYAVPREHGPEALSRVLDLIRSSRSRSSSRSSSGWSPPTTPC